MYVLGNLLYAVAIVLGYACTIITWLVIIRALISWVSPDPYNVIVQILHRATEPILAPFRRIIPAHKLGIDVSPILAVISIMFIRLFVVRTLFDFALRMR